MNVNEKGAVGLIEVIRDFRESMLSSRINTTVWTFEGRPLVC